MGKRAFTLLELMIVLAVGTALTTLGLVVAANVIKNAQYNQQRARLYLDVREGRDRAASGLGFVAVKEITDQSLAIVQTPDCSGATTGAIVTATHTYPAIDSNTDRTACFSARFVSVTPGSLIDFIPLGGGPTDILNFNNDGSLNNSWREFPQEGAFEATSCDPDRDGNCGR